MTWKLIKEKLPPEKVLVETKIHDEDGVRNIQNLMRYKNLYFTSDMKTYVYYTPTHWRYKKAPQ